MIPRLLSGIRAIAQPVTEGHAQIGTSNDRWVDIGSPSTADQMTKVCVSLCGLGSAVAG